MGSKQSFVGKSGPPENAARGEEQIFSLTIDLPLIPATKGFG